jgi:hypothetical protein
MEVVKMGVLVFFREFACPLLRNGPRAAKVQVFLQNGAHMNRFSPSPALFFNYLSYFVSLSAFLF